VPWKEGIVEPITLSHRVSLAIVLFW
jgi:hypothetical protein